MSEIRGPAPRPCESCPYRLDVPSGVWHEDEYAKLPAYDRETMYQPAGVFLCHQQNGRVCAGWVGCHDMSQSLGLRFAAREMDPDDVAACLDYTSPVPLFKTGTEAAAHGLRDLEAPGTPAVRVMSKIARRRS
jgi:hypothetical protein